MTAMNIKGTELWRLVDVFQESFVTSGDSGQEDLASTITLLEAARQRDLAGRRLAELIEKALSYSASA